MTRTQNPVTLAASKVAAAQAVADKADAAVARLTGAQVKAREARAALDAARAELVALITPADSERVGG